MRRITMFNRVTVDGDFAGADGNLNWVVPEDEIDAHGVESLPSNDTILLGRKTYDQFEGFWPKVLDNAEVPDPHAPGRTSPAMRAMAKWIDGARKIVLSKTRKQVTWRNSELVREFDAREIEALKKEAGKGIMIFGSGTVVAQLTRHRLIDEYQFILTPVVLGRGRQLFADLDDGPKLQLLESKGYPSGNVMLRYALAK